MCWHNYGKWHVVGERNDNVCEQGTGLPVYRLKVIFQQRVCIKCGYTDIKKKVIKY